MQSMRQATPLPWRAWRDSTVAAANGCSRSRMVGASETRGEADAFEPVYANLPSAFHSKEAELYFAGEMLRQLPTGQCYVAFRGKTTRITVPPPKRKS